MPFFRVGHFVERHGLILIIALGEGVVALGVGASSQALSLKVLGTVVAGLLLLATLWWAYFGLNQRAAEHRLVNAEPGRRIGMANDFDFAHYPLLAGSILIATALEATIHHPLGHAQSGAAWHLWSGTALFSIGLVLLRWRLGLQAHLPLTLGTTIAALAAIWPVETALLWQIIAAAALMLCIGFSKVSNPGPHEVR